MGPGREGPYQNILLLLFSPREVGSLSKYSSSSILPQGGRVIIKIFFFFYSPPGRWGHYQHILLLLFSPREVGSLSPYSSSSILSREVGSLSKYSSSSILLQGGRVLIKIFFFFYSPPGTYGHYQNILL